MCRISSIFLSVVFSVLTQAADLQRQHQVFLKTSSARTYYIEGQFAGGEPSLFLFDTGSSYTVMNTANLAQLQEKGTVKYLKDLDGRLADGSQLAVPLYRVSTITLDGNCVVRDIDVAVFPNADRQILGLSTLRKLSPFLFLTDPPSLKLSNCGVVELQPLAKDKDRSVNELALAEPRSADESQMRAVASTKKGGDTGEPQASRGGNEPASPPDPTSAGFGEQTPFRVPPAKVN